MSYLCLECKRPCKGELSTDPLLPPALICEYCGGELALLSEAHEPDELEELWPGHPL